MKKYLAEAIGTMFLVFLACGRSCRTENRCTRNRTLFRSCVNLSVLLHR